MKNFPKILSVKALEGLQLLVEFEGAVKKFYDCQPLLKEQTFEALREPGVFKNVHVDPHGYGISWNEELDLSESELWLHGKSEPKLKPKAPQTTESKSAP